VISHIESEYSESGPYKWGQLLACWTRFGVIRGCQEQNRKGGKIQSGQYLACWVGPLHLISEPSIESECPEPESYKRGRLLACWTRFGIMHGCQK